MCFQRSPRLAGAKIPAEVAASLDGRSLVPLLQNPQAEWPERFLVTHVGRWARVKAAESKYLHCRIRNSRYSLVSDARDGARKWELFDLKSDYGEKNNLAPQHPDLVQRVRSGLRPMVDLGSTVPGERKCRRPQGESVQGALLETIWRRTHSGRIARDGSNACGSRRGTKTSRKGK